MGFPHHAAGLHVERPGSFSLFGLASFFSFLFSICFSRCCLLSRCCDEFPESTVRALSGITALSLAGSQRATKLRRRPGDGASTRMSFEAMIAQVN